MQPMQTNVRCSSCGQPFPAQVRNYIDVAQNPQEKVRLMSGQFNVVQCPHCGAVNNISAPILYHDAAKELLIAYVPMELNVSKDQQERIVGDLMKNLPKENFKGYMFNPKRALTMQGVVDMILESDGITPEMMEEQRARVELAQQLIEADDDELPGLIKENDAKIDLRLFQTLSVMAQRMAQGGRPDIAQAIVATQNILAELSTFGQEMLKKQEQQEAMLEEVAKELQALGAGAKRSDVLSLVLKYGADEENGDSKLQALVGLARPALDRQFFDEFTAEIEKESGDERERLQELRERLRELVNIIDQQSQMQIQNAAGLLQEIINSQNPQQVIIENIGLIDDTFMAVLTANIQEMERRNDIQATASLKQIYEMIMGMLQQNMQPELVFVNDLLATDSDSDAKAMIEKQAKEFGEPLLDVMDAVGEVLTANGQKEMARRLAGFREDAVSTLKA